MGDEMNEMKNDAPPFDPNVSFDPAIHAAVGDASLTMCDVLKGGREFMASRKLAKGMFYKLANGDATDDPNQADACCVVGALLAAGRAKPGSLPRNVWQARKAVEQATPDSGMGLVIYNDRDSTTKEDILAAFDKAIAANNCSKPEEKAHDQV